MNRSRLAPLALLLAAACLVGCPKKAGLMAKARPDEPTAAQAIDKKKCDAQSDYGKPLIVDLPSDERGDLEIAMKEGVVVVGYDCAHLAIVPDCHVEGSYGFMGFSEKEEVVRLADQDELDANLPISAGAFGAKLGGDFARGATLDIALVSIGKRRTTKKSAARGDLVSDRPGACRNATHFVRGAMLGAFAMTTGTKAEAHAAAEIFGIPGMGKIGTSGGSASSKDVATKDGSLDACKDASPDAEAPPGHCAALLRLELVKIDDGPRSAPPPADDANASDACAPGLVFADGKCTKATAERPHLCKPNDFDDCEKQCGAGEPGSCGRMGYYYEQGKHFPKDATKAAAFYQKACDANYSVGCASLGALYVNGEGVPKDTVKAVALMQKACDAGDPRFCAFLGGVYYTGGQIVTPDPARAAKLLRLGCDGGSGDGCFLLGEIHRKGVGGAAKDPKRARGYYQKGCDGGEGLACYALAVALDDGIGGPKDPKRAQSIFKRVCDAGLKEACKAVH